MSKNIGLREQALRGGMYLILRQGIGMLISLGGMLLLTRIIGPSNYGLYVTVLGILNYFIYLTELGINVYLIREKHYISKKEYDQSFTLVFITSILLLLIGILLAPLLNVWYKEFDIIKPFVVLLATLPLNSIILPSVAKLERNLNYKLIAVLELLGQFFYYAVALILALMDLGFWSPILGYCTQQVCVAIVAMRFAKYKPNFIWCGVLVKKIIRYGLGYSSSVWVWQLRTLINPVIVGRFVGSEGVGYINLAIRLVEVLSFARKVTYRISISVLAKVQDDFQKIESAINEAMAMQVLALGPFLAGFAISSRWIFSIIFGEKWLPVLYIFPFIALSYLINSVFNMHSSVLYVFKKNIEVTYFHIVHVIFFFGGATILLPKMGLIGYGLAEIVAFVSYFVIHFYLVKLVTPSYNQVTPWLIGFIPLLFTPFIKDDVWIVVFFVPILIVFLFRNPRDQVLTYIRILYRRIV